MAELAIMLSRPRSIMNPYESVKILALSFAAICIANAPATFAIQAAKTINGVFDEESVTVTLGPELNFFAPVPGMIHPESYFEIIGAEYEARDGKFGSLSATDGTTLATIFQQCQNTGEHFLNPAIEDLQLGFKFYPELIGPPDKIERVWNYSIRAEVGDGQASAVGGLVLPGNHPKLVVIRVLGPSLSNFGISAPLADPRLTLIRDNSHLSAPHIRIKSTTEILSNDNWEDNYVGTDPIAERLGVENPNDPNESLIATILDPGIYTARVSSVDGSEGVALLEFYILDDIEVSSGGNW